MKKFTTLALVSLALVACKPLVDTMGDTAPTAPTNEVEQPQAADDSMQNSIAGNYRTYQQGVLTDGSTKVLFFHAAWCPVCKTANDELVDWYESEQIPLPTYRVDYDTETELRQKYGVTVQHTFVLVDGSGDEMTTLTSPSSAELKRLLYGNMDKAKDM